MLAQGEVVRAVQKAATEEAEEAVGMMLGLNFAWEAGGAEDIRVL